MTMTKPVTYAELEREVGEMRMEWEKTFEENPKLKKTIKELEAEVERLKDLLHATSDSTLALARNERDQALNERADFKKEVERLKGKLEAVLEARAESTEGLLYKKWWFDEYVAFNHYKAELGRLRVILDAEKGEEKSTATALHDSMDINEAVAKISLREFAAKMDEAMLGLVNKKPMPEVVHGEKPIYHGDIKFPLKLSEEQEKALAEDEAEEKAEMEARIREVLDNRFPDGYYALRLNDQSKGSLTSDIVEAVREV